MHRLGLLLAFLFAGCAAAPEPPAPPSPPAPPAPPVVLGDAVEGLRVATRVGCYGCHGGNGGGDELWEEPGKFKLYSANLTEKRALYDDAGLMALLREGRTHDGHVPFGMPVSMYQHLSDREVRDVTAWLRALPAVANPDLKESWFADEMKKQIQDGTHPYSGDMQPDPGNVPPREPPTETLALGKHLAMTSCPECHGRDLNGYPGDPTPSLVVAKAYTAEQFVRLMRTGEIAAGGKSKTGLMSGVAAYRFKVMTDAEIAALKQYLDSR